MLLSLAVWILVVCVAYLACQTGDVDLSGAPGLTFCLQECIDWLGLCLFDYLRRFNML